MQTPTKFLSASPMIKLVAFDWNGTLFDDTQMQFRAFNHALKHFKRKPVSLRRFRQTYDVPFSRMWELNGGQASEMQEQNKAYFENYNRYSGKIPLKKHAKKILRLLQKRKIRSIIFSNHPTRLIAKDLARLKIASLIEKTLGRPPGDHTHITQRSKEHRLQKYLQALKVKPGEVLCVGDTIEEIEISKDANFISAALTTGDCSPQRLKKLRPDYLIADLFQIANIIYEHHEHP